MSIKPTAQGWLAIAIIALLCFTQQSLMPLVLALIILVILVPLCIWLKFANERADAQMVRDFPNDPFIQKKYGK